MEQALEPRCAAHALLPARQHSQERAEKTNSVDCSDCTVYLSENTSQ